MDELIDLRIERIYDDQIDSESSSDSSSAEATSVKQSSSGDAHKQGPNVLYDTSLPTLHSYLGNDLEELSGRIVLDDNSCQTISLLPLPGVILVPGQTLPLQLYNPATVALMVQIIKNDRTFGMINSRFSGRTFGNVLDPIGTTAEIRSFREEEMSVQEDGGFPYGASLRIKAEGRQRFEVLEIKRQTEGMILAKIRILPDIVLGDPGVCSRLNSLNKYLFAPPNLITKLKRTEKTKDFIPNFGHKYNKYDYANYTQFPAFVYKLFDAHLLMQRIKNELTGWNRTMKSDIMPLHPQEFSYWVAANLPLDDNQRIALLSINEVVQRLRHELQILEDCSVLRCRDCLIHIANRNDIFSMSLQGPQGTYVNPNGFVHEAITVYRAKGLSMRGRKSTEQSWFPGYAWTIAECNHCKTHIGWRFTAVDKNLKPNKFWAFCRSAIQTSLAEASESEDSVAMLSE